MYQIHQYIYLIYLILLKLYFIYTDSLPKDRIINLFIFLEVFTLSHISLE